MFNRYWRSYPLGLQLILLVLLAFTLGSFTQLIGLLTIPKLSGIGLKSLSNLTDATPPATVRWALVLQAIGSIGLFMMSAIIFTMLAHPRRKEYLGIRPPGRNIQWLLIAGIILGLVPAQMMAESWLMEHVHLGPVADQIQARSDRTFKALLGLRGGGGDLALLLTVMALVPAIGEELLFRGVFLRLIHALGLRWRGRLRRPDSPSPQQVDIQRSMLIPVILTALCFAYIHQNPYGFVFIFIAGCVLALIYQLTGSLVASMLAHFLYNGSQVLLVYFGGDISDKDLPVWIPVLGAALFIGSFYGLVRAQTPLRPDWSEDFLPGEKPSTEV
jgi:membrane protease YdiL (CAAX protease family)